MAALVAPQRLPASERDSGDSSVAAVLRTYLYVWKGSRKPEKGDIMATDTASRVRQHFDESWHQLNPRFADEWYSPDFIYHDVFMGDLDREGFKHLVLGYRKAFPDVRFRLDDIIVAGDVATARWTATGTQRGEFLGIAPTGRSVSVSGMTLFRFAGERQREIWVNWDAYGLMRQLGLAPQPGAGTGIQPPPEAAHPGPEARH
jgi:predicted ester cyclase